jgi:hypothetical protein
VPSQKKRPVVLTESDRAELVRLTRAGVHPASMIMRARVLLALDTSAGEVDAKEVIAARLGVSGETLRLVAKRFADTGGDVHATGLAQEARTAASGLGGDRRGLSTAAESWFWPTLRDRIDPFAGQAAWRMRLRSRSKLARPYICLLIILMRLTLPSTAPELCGMVSPLRTAS